VHGCYSILGSLGLGGKVGGRENVHNPNREKERWARITCDIGKNCYILYIDYENSHRLFQGGGGCVKGQGEKELAELMEGGKGGEPHISSGREKPFCDGAMERGGHNQCDRGEKSSSIFLSGLLALEKGAVQTYQHAREKVEGAHPGGGEGEGEASWMTT